MTRALPSGPSSDRYSGACSAKCANIGTSGFSVASGVATPGSVIGVPITSSSMTTVQADSARSCTSV
jgi:hypothetical protein